MFYAHLPRIVSTILTARYPFVLALIGCYLVDKPSNSKDSGPDYSNVRRNLGLELVRVTEAAALKSAKWLGRGDKDSADQAAVDAMRHVLGQMEIEGTIVIGEGEKDEAPMLYAGEQFGDASWSSMDPYELDIAVDPLDGTTLTADGRNGAASVIAVAERGMSSRTSRK